MSARRYLAFDIETAKVLPDSVDDLFAHRPLGICCAAAHPLDTGEAVLWHGVTDDGSPAPAMSQTEAAALVADLTRLVADGYTLVTWNGLSFDFDILAEESGQRAACIALALSHVDMMFQVVCSQGHFLSLQKAAAGMELPGKLSGISGAEVPALWAAGEHQRVLDYNLQDVKVTAQLAAAGDSARALRWLTQRGKPTRMELPNGWLSVTDAAKLPEPDTSWMSKPPRRQALMAWTC